MLLWREFISFSNSLLNRRNISCFCTSVFVSCNFTKFICYGFCGVFRVLSIKDYFSVLGSFLYYLLIWMPLISFAWIISLAKTYSIMLNRNGEALSLISEKCFGFYQWMGYLWWAYHIWPILHWSTFFIFNVLQDLMSKRCWSLPNGCSLWIQVIAWVSAFILPIRSTVAMDLHIEPFFPVRELNPVCSWLIIILMRYCIRFVSAVGDFWIFFHQRCWSVIFSSYGIFAFSISQFICFLKIFDLLLLWIYF